MRDFDFDANPQKVRAWRERLKAAGTDPDNLDNLIGATERELEGYVAAVEKASKLAAERTGG